MSFFFKFIAFLGVSIFLGLGITAFSLSMDSGFVAIHEGEWKSWKYSGHENADPYTKAFIAKTGQWPLPAQIAQTYFALYDSAHRRLHSSCTYRLDSPPLQAKWWTLAVYDYSGKIVKTELDRYSFNAETAIAQFDGRLHIYLSKTPQPENWLPLANQGPLILALRLYRKYIGDEKAGQKDKGEIELPLIKRVSC